MPDTKDLLQQFIDLPEDRREEFAAHLWMMLPFFPRVLKHRLAEFPSVVSTPNVCGGSARLVRTRIPVWVLERMRQRGFSEAKILECYPTLTAGDLVQAWGYAHSHSAEIGKEIEENERD